MKVSEEIKCYKRKEGVRTTFAHLLLVGLIIFFPIILQAQFGGRYLYKFVNLPSSARIAALGGNLITVMDDDVNLAFANPALLNPEMHQQLAFNHSFHFENISHGSAAFGHHAESIGTTFYGGVKYINYGDFQQTDEFFQQLGTFKAKELAATIGAGRMVNERIALGVNLKYLTSRLETYNSSALALDIAAVYLDTASNFTFSLVVKNMGTILSTYTGLENSDEELPFEIQIGLSKKLRYLPFRFSIIYHNLQQWNLLYDDPNAEQGTIFIGDNGTNGESSVFVQNLFRHFIFNGEFLIGARENFRMRLGYNNFLRQDLTVPDFGSLAGFSFGVGIKVDRFRIDIGHLVYHIAGGVTHLSVSTNLKEFR